MAKVDVFANLRRLSEEDADLNDFEAYKAEAYAEKNDRGVVLLVSSNLENALDMAISSFMPRSKQLSEQLYKLGGPLSSFSNKILIAEALEIFQVQTENKLNSVRKIRNAFAHAKKPISFSTPEVEIACKTLKEPKKIGFTMEDDTLNLKNAKWLFLKVCEITTLNLYYFSLFPIITIDKSMVKFNPHDDRVNFQGRRLPLP